MSKVIKNQATKNIEALINSKSYQESSKQFYKTQLYVAKMNEIMEKKKLKQETVASKMNITQSNLSRLLSGNRPKFSFETLLLFCEATGTKCMLL